MSDYFAGCIKDQYGDVVVENIHGTIMGYVQMGEERWFDLREQEIHTLRGMPVEQCLPSDCRKRKDHELLALEQIDKA